MTSTYDFSCDDHMISIKADSEQDAWIKLEKFLKKGSSDELYTINDFKLEECSNLY